MHAVIWNTLLSGLHLNSFYLGKKREGGGSRKEEKEGERRGKERERRRGREIQRLYQNRRKPPHYRHGNARTTKHLRFTPLIYRMARRRKLVTSI